METIEHPNYIVAIGTSAGGLEALKSFFDNVPSNTNHSFVIIQHLSSDYKSLMAELLAKNTDLPIHEIRDNMVVEPGCVYLIPPKKNVTLKNRKLKLTNKPVGHDLNLPIDIFFKSLADDMGENAIGIILSGTGSDGTRGARAIKEVAGMIMVQSPESAKFDGMPNSAIATGLVDYIISIDQMPDELIGFINNPKTERVLERNIMQDSSILTQILHHIRTNSKFDFEHYKRPTLTRRIARRMNITKCDNSKDYLSYLYNHPEEVQTLYGEFLIGVTRFFRDDGTWITLADSTIPKLVEETEENGTIKIWIAACSTGEEAYSVAILLKEALEESGKSCFVKIFATDINKSFLEKASKGIYRDSILPDIGQERIDKYFSLNNGYYQIDSEIRKMIIFSQHDMVKDPPFSKMDMVFCRNVLIYFQPTTQQKVLGVFHYALKVSGVLVLGSSESIGDFKNVFREVSRKDKIFQNIKAAKSFKYRNAISSFGESGMISVSKQMQHEPSRRSASFENQLAEVLNETLTEFYGSAAVYVSDTYDIIYAVGEFRKFIELPEKGFSVNLLKMLPSKLSMAISTAIRKAKQLGKEVYHKEVLSKKDDKVFHLNLLVKFFELNIVNKISGYLIVFSEQSVQTDQYVKLENNSSNHIDTDILSALEHELNETKETLQYTIEELETSNEELQATNEELLASNEELQSTNEELQSLNEELHTVNAEHQHKIEDLATLNTDMDNLFNSTDIGTVFLDENLTIRKFTPAILTQFHLNENDIGRPISNFNSSFGEKSNKALLKNAQLVIKTGQTHHLEIKSNDGIWYLRKITPFTNGDGVNEGVVISFVDIDNLKKTKLDLDKSEGRLNSIFTSIDAHISLVNKDGTIEYINHTLDTVDRDGYIGSSIYSWLDKENKVRVKGLIRDAFDESKSGIYDSNFKAPDGKTYHFQNTLSPVCMSGKIVGVSVVSQNITGIINLNKKLKSRTETLESANRELEQFTYIVSHDLKAPITNLTGLINVLELKDGIKDSAEEIFNHVKSSLTNLDETISTLNEVISLKKNLQLPHESISFQESFDKVRGVLEFQIRETDADISADFNKVKMISYPPVHLNHILQNLLSNAIKYHRKGTRPIISVRTIKREGQICLEVKDNGRGMDLGPNSKLFGLFQRFHSDTEGRGIGLHVIKSIIENLGGKIEVKSQPNKGTTFNVIFEKDNG